MSEENLDESLAVICKQLRAANRSLDRIADAMEWLIERIQRSEAEDSEGT